MLKLIGALAVLFIIITNGLSWSSGLETSVRIKRLVRPGVMDNCPFGEKHSGGCIEEPVYVKTSSIKEKGTKQIKPYSSVC